MSGDRYCKRFSAWQQFLTCLYAQITGKDSLREIASGPATNQSRLYRLGMTAVAKSTLPDAMNRRSPDIFKALFEEFLLPELSGTASNTTIPSYAIDSTTIDLGLSQYDWAHYRKHKGAIELFFKWIKQNIKIKSFLETSEKAVMTQIWGGLIHYLPMAYIKFPFSLPEMTLRIREALLSVRIYFIFLLAHTWNCISNMVLP